MPDAGIDSGDPVNAMTCDAKGNLWLVTDKMIKEYTTDGRRHTIHNNNRYADVSQFLDISSKDGRIIVTCSDAQLVVDPDYRSDNPHRPSLTTASIDGTTIYAFHDAATQAIPAGQSLLVVDIYDGQTRNDTHKLLLTDVNASQARLSAKYNEALQLYNNECYVNGREAMNIALVKAKPYLSSYYEPEIDIATDALQAAITAFIDANPGVANVSCRNYYLKAADITTGNMYACVTADGTLALTKRGYSL